MPHLLKYRLEISAFICGAVVMVYELLGSRIIAPYLGTSIYAWTSLIGIILLSLSGGYWFGGRLADNKPSIAVFSKAILVASACVTLTLIIESRLLNLIQYLIMNGFLSLALATFIANLLLFAPASFFLGIITPYAVKLKSEEILQNYPAAKNNKTAANIKPATSPGSAQTARLGRTVGNLYAISTVGSIAGTFSAGYLLIPFFGTRLLVAMIASVLLILSTALHPKNLKNIRSATLYILVFVALLLFFSFKLAETPDAGLTNSTPPIAAHPGQGTSSQAFPPGQSPSTPPTPPVFADLDTPYNRIWIVEEQYNKQPVRWLKTNPFGFQSGINLNDPAALVSPYMQFFTLHRHFNPQAKEILMIGGGGLAYAKYHQENDPQINLDIVEIDPKLTEIAQKYFLYKPSPGIKIINEDGRIYINQSPKKYDVILLDAFTSIFSIPYTLTTLEAVQKYHDLLNPGGVIIANIISPLTGPKAQFLRAEYLTFQKIFPRVQLYQSQKADPALIQGILLVAFKSEPSPSLSAIKPPFPNTPPPSALLYGQMLENEVSPSLLGQSPASTSSNPDLPPLTDDYAPVDYYIDKLLY